MTRDLKGTIEREKAEIGVFITLEEPTREMELEATTAGVYTSPIDGRDDPRIQIITIRELLEEGKKPMLPLLILFVYQEAERIADKKARRATGVVRLTARPARVRMAAPLGTRELAVV